MFSGKESGEAENQTRDETAKCPGDMDDGTEDVSQSSKTVWEVLRRAVAVFLFNCLRSMGRTLCCY